MKHKIFVLLFVPTLALCQESARSRFQKLPLIVSINFMAISTPFQKIQNNFRNVGVRVGTEVGLNQKENLFQSVNIGYYRNKLNGDGIYMNSELIYRPKIKEQLRMDFRVGPGIAEIFRPSRTWQPNGQGDWERAPITNRLNLQLHAGLGLTYSNLQLNNLQLSPFLQYEMVGVVNYNKGVPILPLSFINAGSRIKF